MDTSENYWRKCSTCKKTIGLNSRYYECSVSTCNSKRTGYVFCGIPCFDSHVPGARHKNAGAVEMKAPNTPAPKAAAPAERAPQRRIVSQGPTSSPVANSSVEKEILIVASRLKNYILKSADFNTSSNVMDVLSDHVRVISERAIDNAKQDGRKTVLDRDFSFLKKL